MYIDSTPIANLPVEELLFTTNKNKFSNKSHILLNVGKKIMTNRHLLLRQ